MDAPAPPSQKDVGTTDPLNPPIQLDKFTSARLAFVVSKTGKSPAELLAAALELLWPASDTNAGIPAIESDPPPKSHTIPPGFREAWRCSLGWTKEVPPPPTIDDLLPPEMLRQALELWLATGTNVLYTHVQGMFVHLEGGGPEAWNLVKDSLEVEIIDRLEKLRKKWKGEREA